MHCKVELELTQAGHTGCLHYVCETEKPSCGCLVLRLRNRHGVFAMRNRDISFANQMAALDQALG